MDLIDILKEIVRYPTITNSELNDDMILEKFENLYSDPNYRHLYSDISEYIEKLSLDESTFLEEFLKKLVQQSKDNKQVNKSLVKLLDHVSLEGIRIARIRTMDYKYDQLTRNTEEAVATLTDATEKTDKLQKESEEISNKVSKIQAETIEILGIFAGLVIGFATSFQLLEVSFSNLNSVGFYKLLSFLCVIGTILFDCIFLLLFSVARISQRSIALNCKKTDCLSCNRGKKCRNSLSRFAKKYPYVVWYNSLMILIFGMSAVFYYFMK